MTATTTKRPRSTLRTRFASASDYLAKLPGFDYLVLRIIIFLLVGIGVVMVFSSSAATSLTDTGSVWNQAVRQSLMVVAGLIVFWVALRMRPRMIRVLVPWLLGLAFLLLIAVLIPGVGTGREEVGSQSWIILGPISVQPSEFARVAIGLFGATSLAGKKHQSLRPGDPFVAYSLVSSAMFILILLQGDLGMAMSFALVVLATLFFAGVDLRVVGTVIAFAFAAMVFVFLGGGFRSHRFHTYFDALRGNIEDTQGTGFQAYQGFLSLADGGLGGVGIGQSRAKWFYLPEAKNDFVFAIVGEELGLWGGLLVIFLFTALGFFGIRTAMRAQSQFQSLVAATLTAGVVSQAFFNIGYVIGLLPVTGIQLPMISAGGTAAIITIGSMGLLCNVARHEPEQISAMQNYGRPLFDRLFAIPEPEPLGAPRRGGKRRADGTGAPRDSVLTAGSRARGTRGAEGASSHERRFGPSVTGGRAAGRGDGGHDGRVTRSARREGGSRRAYGSRREDGSRRAGDARRAGGSGRPGRGGRGGNSPRW